MDNQFELSFILENLKVNKQAFGRRPYSYSESRERSYITTITIKLKKLKELKEGLYIEFNNPKEPKYPEDI